jgi:glycosyltransferase involved in cell wall biosynthesis
MGFHSRVVLLGQRLSRWLPAPLRDALKRIPGMSRVYSTLDGGVEVWAAPLLGGSHAAIEWPPRAAISVRVEPQARPDSEITCLLVTESLDSGGMDEFVAFLARGLPEFGVTASVMLAPTGASRGLGPIAMDLMSDGIRVLDASAVRGRELVEREAPDIIALHGNARWPLELAKDLAIPAILVLHGMHDLFNMPQHELLERYGMLSGVLCVSEMVRRQYLSKSSLIDPGRVLSIPNGIDRARTRGVDRLAARAALGLDREFLFLSLSRHCLQKNNYGLVSAFDDVAKRVSGTHMLVCGRSDDAAYTAQVAGLKARLSSSGRIHLRTNTRRTDVLLAAADAFVLDSFFEGWALSSMEALVSGLPVILSDVGGAREQLTGGPLRGLLVPNPAGDPLTVDWDSMARWRFARQPNRQELVEAMQAVATGQTPLADPQTIATDAIRRFDSTRCVERHAHALKAIVAGSPSTEL